MRGRGMVRERPGELIPGERCVGAPEVPEAPPRSRERLLPCCAPLRSELGLPGFPEGPGCPLAGGVTGSMMDCTELTEQ